MNSELQQKIFTDFPELFQYRDGNDKLCISLFGIECADGWFHLIYNLCDTIANRKRLNPHLEIPNTNVTQIKEKFGGLRFYYDGGDDEVSGSVSLAENMSYSICEFCGTTKDVGRTEGWIITCCEDCYKKHASNLNIWKLIK